MNGTLYLVATPIGNLQDMTFRAVETLKKVEIIACEDTRHTRKLLTHFGISAKLVSYHEYNETERAEEFGKLLSEGKSIAVVSDAGTPAICDPSFKVVQKAIEIGAKIVPIPGAVAFVNALIVSGISTDSVFFGGFLPSKKGDRLKRLEEVAEIPATLCFYETPHRIAKSLIDCWQILGNRKSAVVREITKLHEEILRGNLDELAKQISEKSIKGEIVLIINKKESENRKIQNTSRSSIAGKVAEFQMQGIDHKNALKKTAKEFGLSKSEAYRILQTEKK